MFSDYDCQKIYNFSWDDDFEPNDDMEGQEEWQNDNNREGSEGETDDKDSGNDLDKDNEDEHHDDDYDDDENHRSDEEEAQNDDMSYEGDDKESEDNKSPNIAAQTVDFMIAPENAMVEGNYHVVEVPRETIEEAVEDRVFSGEDIGPDVA